MHNRLQITSSDLYCIYSDLQAIDTLKGSVSSSDHLHSNDDVINRAMYTYITAIFVGERLLREESLLLPFIHEKFSDCASEILHTVNLELQNEDTNRLQHVDPK